MPAKGVNTLTVRSSSQINLPASFIAVLELGTASSIVMAESFEELVWMEILSSLTWVSRSGADSLLEWQPELAAARPTTMTVSA